MLIGKVVETALKVNGVLNAVVLVVPKLKGDAPPAKVELPNGFCVVPVACAPKRFVVLLAAEAPKVFVAALLATIPKLDNVVIGLAPKEYPVTGVVVAGPHLADMSPENIPAGAEEVVDCAST